MCVIYQLLPSLWHSNGYSGERSSPIMTMFFLLVSIRCLTNLTSLLDQRDMLLPTFAIIKAGEVIPNFYKHNNINQHLQCILM